MHWHKQQNDPESKESTHHSEHPFKGMRIQILQRKGFVSAVMYGMDMFQHVFIFVQPAMHEIEKDIVKYEGYENL